jgi:excisionase family DNA binding protein
MEKLLSVAEAAEKLGVHRTRINQLIDSGALPAARIGRAYVIREDDLEKVKHRPAPGRPTIGERLNVIAGEILEELSDQFAEFVVHKQAPDSNDWDLTYTDHDGGESRVHVIRRASQTDDEIKDEIRTQLATEGDRELTKPRHKASKKAAKGTGRKRR